MSVLHFFSPSIRFISGKYLQVELFFKRYHSTLYLVHDYLMKHSYISFYTSVFVDRMYYGIPVSVCLFIYPLFTSLHNNSKILAPVFVELWFYWKYLIYLTSNILVKVLFCVKHSITIQSHFKLKYCVYMCSICSGFSICRYISLSNNVSLYSETWLLFVMSVCCFQWKISLMITRPFLHFNISLTTNFFICLSYSCMF